MFYTTKINHFGNIEYPAGSFFFILFSFFFFDMF